MWCRSDVFCHVKVTHIPLSYSHGEVAQLHLVPCPGLRVAVLVALAMGITQDFPPAGGAAVESSRLCTELRCVFAIVIHVKGRPGRACLNQPIALGRWTGREES